MQGTNPAPLKAHPLSGCAKEPFRGGKPPRDGVLALAFHTLLSFQGTSPGCSSATHLRFPRPVTAGAAGRYHGPVKIVKDFPPARSAYSCWSTTCHVVTFTQKRRPAPRPSGRQDGHRTAVGSNPLGARRPPVFRCRREWRRSGEVLGLEELPCLQLGDGSTGFDSVSTWRHPLDASNHNGSSGLSPSNGRRPAGIPRPVRTLAVPGGGPGTDGRRSTGARPAPRGSRSARSSRPAGRRAGSRPG